MENEVKSKFFESKENILGIEEIRGLLYSGPLAEGLAFLIALVFLIGEIRKLNINDDKCINVLDNINYKEDIDKDENNNKNIIITIAREYGVDILVN